MKKSMIIVILFFSILISSCAALSNLPNTDETINDKGSHAESSPLPANPEPENPDMLVILLSDTEDVIITSYWDNSVTDTLSVDDIQLLIDVFQGKELSDQVPACDNDIKIEFDNSTLLIHTACGSVVYMTGEQTGSTELSDTELDVLLDILRKYDIGTEA